MDNFNNLNNLNNLNKDDVKDQSSQSLHSNEKAFQDYEFNSFSVFNDIGGGSGSFNVEDYAFQELDLDAKYRSIQAVNPNSFSAYHSPALQSTAPPQLSKASSPTVPIVFSTKSASKALPDDIVKRARNVNVPEQPFYIAVTQFICNRDFDMIMFSIENELSCVAEVSFEFFSKDCTVSFFSFFFSFNEFCSDKVIFYFPFVFSGRVSI
jgi:hypothetical protein